jgi:hypothetical protein
MVLAFEAVMVVLLDSWPEVISRYTVSENADKFGLANERQTSLVNGDEGVVM